MLVIKDLYYEYEDGTQALKDINIDGSKGKVIGIIGANGSGKSTLFLNIMGILKPKSGAIIYKNKKISYKKSNLRNYRKDVNIVFQNPDQQLFYSNVYDDMAFPLRNIGYSEKDIEKKVNKALELVGCIDLINKPIHFLSYGQKKRIAIAGILAMDGQTILMDEPSSGLDPYTTEEIKNIIKDISSDKQVFISSHDMDLIYEICDYIYILSNGSIISEGLTEEVFLDNTILEEAYLKEPWLIKIYKKFNMPLFKSEAEFNKYKLEE